MFEPKTVKQIILPIVEHLVTCLNFFTRKGEKGEFVRLEFKKKRKKK